MQRIVLVGCGVVGQGFLEIISRKRNILKRMGLDFRIVGVIDSSGGVIDENGIDPLKILEIKKRGNLPEGIRFEDVINSVDFDIGIEVTPTNPDTGEPGLSYIKAMIERGVDVITSNKGPLIVAYKDLMRLASKNGVQFKFEATVGGAMPVISLVERSLAGNQILSIEGIFNGTSNYILSRMEKELLPYSQVLLEAQELGIAEKDPTFDVEGIDTAGKLVILANAIMGIDAGIKDVEITGITGITTEAMDLAQRNGYAIRLIGEANREGQLKVSPKLIPRFHPLALDGTLNAALIQTDLAGEVFIIGRGAGKIETASAILSDLISIST